MTINSYYHFICNYKNIHSFINKNIENPYFVEILQHSAYFNKISKEYRPLMKKSRKTALKSVLELNSIYLAVSDQIPSSYKRNELLQYLNKDLTVVKLTDDKKAFLNLSFLFYKEAHNLKMNNYNVHFDLRSIKVGQLSFKCIVYSVVVFDQIDTYLVHWYKKDNALTNILSLKSNLDSKPDLTKRDNAILAKLKANRRIKENDDLEELIHRIASLETDIEAIEAELKVLKEKRSIRKVKKVKTPILSFLVANKNREYLDSFINECKVEFRPNKGGATLKEQKLNKKLVKLENEYYYKSIQLKKTVEQDLREYEFKTYLLSEVTTYKDLSLYEKDLLE